MSGSRLIALWLRQKPFPAKVKFIRFSLVLVTAVTLSGLAQAKTDSIVLGGGCFWCLDASYKLLPGVTHVTCGYAGGTVKNPTYEQVSAHNTGHAEVVKVEFDTDKVSFAQLLEFFWHVHDPTQVGGQGNDIGPQYRSIILYSNPAQKAGATASLIEAQKGLKDKITTEIVALTDFWPAEEYHQDYFAKNPNQAYCALIIKPKVSKLKQFLETVGLKSK